MSNELQRRRAEFLAVDRLWKLAQMVCDDIEKTIGTDPRIRIGPEDWLVVTPTDRAGAPWRERRDGEPASTDEWMNEGRHYTCHACLAAAVMLNRGFVDPAAEAQRAVSAGEAGRKITAAWMSGGDYDAEKLAYAVDDLRTGEIRAAAWMMEIELCEEQDITADWLSEEMKASGWKYRPAAEGGTETGNAFDGHCGVLGADDVKRGLAYYRETVIEELRYEGI